MPADIAALLVASGRVLFGAAFAFAGLRNLANFGILSKVMAGTGVPAPRLVLALGLVLLTASGLGIMAGFMLAWAGFGLALFLVTATLLFHRFWQFSGAERVEHLNAFISNTALMGGALAMAGLGS